jgi:hypothetical protein
MFLSICRIICIDFSEVKSKNVKVDNYLIEHKQKQKHENAYQRHFNWRNWATLCNVAMQILTILDRYFIKNNKLKLSFYNSPSSRVKASQILTIKCRHLNNNNNNLKFST